MRKKFKIISIFVLFSFSLLLSACGSNSGKVSKDNIKEAAEGYICAYLHKENNNLEKAGLSKEEVYDLVTKRDYHVVNLYSRQDGKDGEILRAYCEALKNIEYSVKSTSMDNDTMKAVVTIKGIDISKIERNVIAFAMKTRREKNLTREELYAAMEEEAEKELKDAEKMDEKDIELTFSKESDGRLKLEDESINLLENSLTYVEENYSKFTGDVPEEFKSNEEEN